MIIENLFIQFQLDLREQKSDFITKNTVKQMHILCTEKNREQSIVEKFQKG